MHRRFAVILTLLSLAVSAFAAEPSRPVTGFELGSLDKSVDPCSDFYRFACGGWLKANPIPGDQPRWGRFSELYERNRLIIRDILEKAAVDRPGRTANEQKIGDLYASCMDEAAIEARGLQPIESELARIDAITSKEELSTEIARLHRLGADVLFSAGAEQDAKDTAQMIFSVNAGGQGLPERDYYLREDARSVELRNLYVQHVANMLRLSGIPDEQATAQARAIMALETSLARNSLTVVARRTPANVYHKLPFAELDRLAPGFSWATYMAAFKAPAVETLNISEPDFVKAMGEVLAKAEPATLKAYLRWHLLSAMSTVLPSRFYDESFNFYNRAMRGQKEQPARWKRCSAAVDAYLGEAVGEAFVAVAFGADSKVRTQNIVEQIEKSMRRNIEQLDWMSPETKKQAYLKLAAIANKIGYPSKWRDYSALSIARGEFAGNSLRAREFEADRDLAKIGKPVDLEEWSMTPATVNAYFRPLKNDINFPAGILQPPFFDKNRDETYNYGGIGAVIGHELTHGFDDMGRQFDEKGNLRDWWTKADNDEFNRRSGCFVDQYGNYPVVEDVKLNGKLTLGENVADAGGLRLALMSALATLTDKNRGKVDGYTPEQRVFLGFAQVWCTNGTPQVERMLALTDPHSQSRWRVNGTLSNFTEFQKAWGCKSDAPMVRRNACRVW